MKNKKFRSFLSVLMLVVLVAVVALSFMSCRSEQGKKDELITITVEVVGKSGESKEHVVETDAATLADALTEAGIASGDDGEYGLYITTVDGEVADYSVDSSYWSITKNGEELFTGASQTNIADGEHYELTYTIYK